MARPKTAKESCLPGQSKSVLIPFEGELDLVTHIEFNINGRQWGAYLLRIGERKYRLVFGFECDGIHPNLPPARVDAIYNQLTSGFKDLPEGEILTIHAKSFVDNSSRMKELSNTVSGCKSDVLQYILVSEQKRLETLTKQGMRKPKSLTLFATFTFDPESDVKEDKIEAFTKGIYKIFTKFSGAEKVARTREFTECLEAGVTSFYLWEQVLSNKMGLGIRPMSSQELWADLWGRVNTTPAPPVPQKVIFNGKTPPTEDINRSLHPLSVLLDDEWSVPKADYRWINVKKKFVGLMAMLDQPDQWSDPLDAMTYLWKKMGEDSIYDVELVTQISKVSQTRTRKKLKDLTDEQIYKADKAAAEGDINVGATIDAEEAIDAQAILHRGGVALSISSVFMVHRDTIEELDRSCDYLKSLFLYPANLHREFTYTWRTWLQTMPVCWDMMLSRPFNRQGQVFTNYVPGTVPLALVKTYDQGGLELLSNEGGVPLYIDLVNNFHHILWLATTRAGKSVAITGLLNGVLAHGIPVTIIDCPPTKEASTFRDYTHLLDGAFFDVGDECSNILEIPNVAHLSPAVQIDRQKDYEDFLLEILLILVCGSNPDRMEPMLRDLVRSLLTLVMTKFFAAREIQSRYVAAIKGGLGSEAWQEYPVLEDFISYCSPERVKITEAEQLKALSFIVTKLRSWTESRIGKAFCRPSTFDTNAQLFVLALRGVSNAEDMAVLSTIAYGTALRRAYGSSKSVLLLDEAAVLLKYPSLSLMIGKLLAIAAKAGIRVMLAAQEVDSIESSAGGKQILANCDLKLVGRLQPEAVDSISEVLKVPYELLQDNITKVYEPNKGWGYSNWLFLDGRSYTRVRIYSSPGSLAAVVNNPHEVKRRQELLDAAENPILGLHQYASELMPT
jgi:TraM recognition site of TraD and TraG